MRLKAWYRMNEDGPQELVDILSIEWPDFGFIKHIKNPDLIVIFVNDKGEIHTDWANKFKVLSEELKAMNETNFILDKEI